MKRTTPVLLLLLSAMTGCAPATAEIRGKVTLNGASVPDAQIQFVSSDTTRSPAFARADKDGRYHVLLLNGDYTVRILAQKSVPPPPGTLGPYGKPLEAITVDLLPKKYNAESELRATVTGNAELDFKLTSETP